MSATRIAVVPGPGAPKELSTLLGNKGVTEWDPARVEKSGALDSEAGIVFLFADAGPAEAAGAGLRASVASARVCRAPRR